MHLSDRFVEPGKKDKLSEEEMLAKKAEAAQRRKMQVEKATKESEVGVKIAQPLNLWNVSISRSHQLYVIFVGWSYKENIGPGLWEEEGREEAKGAGREGSLHNLILLSVHSGAFYC